MTYRGLVSVLTVVHPDGGGSNRQDGTADASGISTDWIAGSSAVDPELLGDLRASFNSLLAQADSRWQWCVVVAGSAPEGTLAAVQELIVEEPRALAAPGGSDDPAELARLALELARAETVAWLDPGDLLDGQTVAAVRAGLELAPWVYTDEAAVDADGSVVDHWLKPDYSPELLRSQPYPVRLAALPSDTVLEVGGIRAGTGSAAWYDLVLRVADRLGPAHHLAGPFYLHGRRRPGGAPYVVEHPLDRCRVVAETLVAAGEQQVEVAPVAVGGHAVGQHVRRPLDRHPRISLIIPTRASTSLIHGLPRCHVVEFVRSLWRPDRYPNLEVVVAYDQEDTPAAALDELREITGGAVELFAFRGPFHFSRKCNAAAMHATGEYLCFLNDDMELVTPDWLHEMGALLIDRDVVAVGARLLFADGTLQHAGHKYNDGIASHMLFKHDPETLDLGGIGVLTSERSGVTAACMLLRAGDFLRVGGFSEEFPLSYNDVDLCLKLRALDKRILYTPHATLFHYESQTREAEITPLEMLKIQRRWLPQLQLDPYLNELLRVPVSGPDLSVD